jgi:hypothetical protein
LSIWHGFLDDVDVREAGQIDGLKVALLSVIIPRWARRVRSLYECDVIVGWALARADACFHFIQLYVGGRSWIQDSVIVNDLLFVVCFLNFLRDYAACQLVLANLQVVDWLIQNGWALPENLLDEFDVVNSDDGQDRLAFEKDDFCVVTVRNAAEISLLIRSLFRLRLCRDVGFPSVQCIEFLSFDIMFRHVLTDDFLKTKKLIILEDCYVLLVDLLVDPKLSDLILEPSILSFGVDRNIHFNLLAVFHRPFYYQVESVHDFIFFVDLLPPRYFESFCIVLQLLELVWGQSAKEAIGFQQFQFSLHVNDRSLLQYPIIVLCFNVSQVSLLFAKYWGLSLRR